MKENSDVSVDAIVESGTIPVTTALDWRKVADQRLSQLVELEHDYSVVRDRLSLLQIDYRESLAMGVDQLRRIQDMDDRLADLAHACASMRADYEGALAALLGSRSWRLTRPFRAISMWLAASRRRSGRLLRSMLRVPLLRRMAKMIVWLVPGLHARLRSRLYPHG